MKKSTLLEKLIIGGFFSSGFAALSYEQVWTQLLTLVYGASIYAFSVMLTVFFLGLALGSYLMSRIADRLTMPLLTFSFVELAIGIFGLLLLPVFTKLDEPYLFFYLNAPSHYYFMLSLFLMPLFLLLPTTLMGATLPLITRIFAPQELKIGRALGDVFSANTLGSIFGAFITGFFLLPFLGLEKTVLIAALANIAVAVIIFFYARRLLLVQKVYSTPLGKHFTKRKRQFFALTAFSLVLAFLIGSYSLDPSFAGVYYTGKRFESVKEWSEAKENFEIIHSNLGLYGLVTVGRNNGELYLTVNGKTESSTTRGDMKTQYSIAYIPLLMHGNAQKVLNIGLGGGFTLDAITTLPVEEVDCVEISPTVAEVAESRFSSYNHQVLKDSEVNLIIGDGRNHLWHSKQRYDVIISEPSNPWISGEGHLFTVEFFEIVASHLREGGIFCQWVPMYEHDSGDLKVMLNSLREVFPNLQIYSLGSDMIILASEQPIRGDFPQIVEQLSREGVKRNLVPLYEHRTAPGLADSLFKTYLMGSEEVDNYIEGVEELNTDTHTVLEFQTALNTMKKEYYSHRRAMEPIKDIIEFKRSYSGSPFFSPPLYNLVKRKDGEEVIYPLGVVVNPGEGWSRGSLRYGHMVVPTQTSLVYSPGRSVAYRLPRQGSLGIVALESKGLRSQGYVEKKISKLFGLDSMVLLEEGDTYYTYSVGSSGSSLGGLAKAQHCNQTGYLYLAVAAFPGKGNPSEALNRIDCLR